MRQTRGLNKLEWEVKNTESPLSATISPIHTGLVITLNTEAKLRSECNGRAEGHTGSDWVATGQILDLPYLERICCLWLSSNERALTLGGSNLG